MKMNEADELDEKIIKMLKENSRKPFTEIAETLGISEATVRKRVRKMERNEIIKGYSLEIDPSALGYDTVVLLGLDVEPESLVEAAKEISEIEEAKRVTTCTGDHMIMTEIWAKDNSHLSKIMSEKIGKIEGVKNLCPAIVMEELKKK